MTKNGNIGAQEKNFPILFLPGTDCSYHALVGVPKFLMTQSIKNGTWEYFFFLEGRHWTIVTGFGVKTLLTRCFS